MHILFFTYDTIFPSDSGGKTRAYNLIKYGMGDAKISLFSFMRDGYDLANLEQIKKLRIEDIELFPRRSKTDLGNFRGFVSPTHSVFYPLYFDPKIFKSLLAFIKEKKVDLVHFESFYTGFYLFQELATLGVKQVYGSENIEYRLYQDSLKSLNPVSRLVAGKQVGKIEKEEIEMAKKSDTVLAVANTEVEYFKRFNKRAVLIPNGVDIGSFPLYTPKKAEKCRMLFVGNFSYFPNKDGLNYFLKQVWPKLDQNKFELTVVGKGSTGLKIDSEIKTIEYVPDIYTAYAETDVFISPMRFGGGTNFKVLEAMATGLPVVALSEKIKGIEGINNKHFLTAEDTAEFVSCLNKLEQDFALREILGRNARELIKKEYAWPDIGKKLYNVWQDLVNEKN